MNAKEERRLKRHNKKIQKQYQKQNSDEYVKILNMTIKEKHLDGIFYISYYSTIFIILLLLLYIGTYSGYPRITAQQYSDIHIGMTVSDVDNYLGKGGNFYYEITYGDTTIQKYDYIENFHGLNSVFHRPLYILSYKNSVLESKTITSIPYRSRYSR